MKQIIGFLAVFFFFSYSMGQSSIKTDSTKYAHHNNYTSFLTFLKDSIQNMDNDMDKLIFIRRRVAEIIDRGAGGKDLSLSTDKWTDYSGQSFYNIFYNNTATVKCGGTSFFLKDVYTDLGYESETFDMGCPRIYTHQVTVVKNNQDEQWYVQDAFYNISYFDKKSGNTISFVKMLSYLKQRKDRAIKIKFDSYEYQPEFDTTGLYSAMKKLGLEYNPSKVLKLSKLSRKKWIKMSQKIMKRAKQCLIENNFPNKSIYLYLLPLEHNSSFVKLFFD